MRNRACLCAAFVLMAAMACAQDQLPGQTPSGSAPSPTSASTPAPSSKSANQMVVPARTILPLELRSTINTRTAYVGELVYCDTLYPVTVDNRIVIPVGSYVKGEVSQLVRPGRVRGRAQIGLRFIELTLPNGVTVPLRGTLTGLSATGNENFKRNEGKVQGEGSKGRDAATVGQVATSGAIIGAIADRGAKGAGIGGAAGAATGLIWVLATRGKDIVLPQGTSLEFELNTPLTFNSHQINFPTQSAPPTAVQRHPNP